MGYYEKGLDVIGGHGGGGHGGGHGGGRGLAFAPWGWGGYDVDDDGGDTYITNINITPDEKEDLLGFEDIGERQKEMNTLKTLTVSLGQTLVKYGQQTIAGAISGAQQPWYKPDLPGATARQNVADALQRHANALIMLASTPDAIYAGSDDLKKQVVQAFIEANAVQEGNAQLDIAWGAMWAEIGNKLMQMPAEIVKQVSDVMPMWMKVSIGVGVGIVALALGFTVYSYASRR